MNLLTHIVHLPLKGEAIKNENFNLIVCKPDRPTWAAFSNGSGSLAFGQSFRWPVSSTLAGQVTHEAEHKNQFTTGVAMRIASHQKLGALIFAFALVAVSAQAQTDPLGGKPPVNAKASVADLDYQVTYQRAFEAVLWSMPAVSIYGFQRGAVGLGAGPNVILAWSKPAKPNLEAMTGNNQVPYIVSQTDLRNGPVVVEIPAASERASLYGQIVDHWQMTIADIGPSGIDKGRGGKILLTPPGYTDRVSAKFIEVKSPSYRVAFAFRAIPGAESSMAQAYDYAQTLKMYYLSELPRPVPTKFIDPIDLRYSTLPHYDETWFEHLHSIISVENVYPRDKVMMGMLASLGIEKGKPYNPDAKTKKAMRQAVIDAYHYMLQRTLHPTDNSRIWWKGKHWYDGLFADANRQFSYEYADKIDIDNRADRYYIGTFYPKGVGPKPATQYLFALADKNGDELQAGKTYSFTMPAKVPAEQFWSLIVYDLETMSFIYNPLERAGLSSFDLPNMKKNNDGSVTMYFGPNAPTGLESNWIPTAGKWPIPTIRIYGGTEEFWNKSWEMPDVEPVE